MLPHTKGWKAHISDTDPLPPYEELWQEVLRVLELLKRSYDMQIRQRQQPILLLEPGTVNDLLKDEFSTPVKVGDIFVELADEGHDGARQRSIEKGESSRGGERKDERENVRGNVVIGAQGMLNGDGGRLDKEEDREEKRGQSEHVSLKRIWEGVLANGGDEEHDRRDHQKKQKKNTAPVPERKETREETLNKDLNNLKQVLRVERRENVALRAQTAALETKIGAMLAAMHSKMCEHCRSIYQEHNIRNVEVPEPPFTSKKPKSPRAPPIVGEEVAVEVIRSKFLMPQNATNKLNLGRVKVYQGRRRGKILGVENIGSNIEAPDAFGRRSPEEVSQGRKQGPEVSKPGLGGGENLEENKHVADSGKEQTPPKSQPPRNSPRVLDSMPSSPEGPEPSPGYSLSVDEAPGEEIAHDDAEQGKFEPCQEGGSARGNETKAEESGLKTANDSDSEDTETDTNSDLKDLQTGSINASTLRSRARNPLPSLVASSPNKHVRDSEKHKRQQDRAHRTSFGVGEYTEFKCGITSKVGVDTYGLLKVYQQSGIFQVFCHCGLDGCAKDKPMTPGHFEKHGGRAASKKWRESIWIERDNQRMPISRIQELDEYIRTPQRKREEGNLWRGLL